LSIGRAGAAAALCLSLGAITGCGAIKGMALNTVADTLSSGGGDTFTRDDDIELVRDATAFALKLNETLLESVPKNKGLLLGTCSGFTQYAYAFIQTDAIVLGQEKFEEVTALNQRALNMYLRARGYCLRALELRFKGAAQALARDPATILAKAKKSDVPLLYWTAASWGSAIALGVDRPDLVIDLPTVRTLAERALALDEGWSNGAIHEMMISLESLPEAIGGSVERARKHFARAVEIQKGELPGPYVALALGVSVGANDEAEFRKMIDAALAIDPKKQPSVQLVTLITQRRAKALLAQVDTIFVK
jgi:predicted anti-sigma-YlaC factor YlaD